MFKQNIFLSFKNKIKNMYYKNYFLPHNSKKIQKYNNIAKDKRCFIVCNGPSLNANDLEMLYKNDEDCFAMNRIYTMFSKTNWRPTYYMCQDYLVIEEKREEINNIDCKNKFIPADFLILHNMAIDNANYFNINYDINLDKNTYSISEDCSKRINDRGTVTFSCIQLAVYMGYKEIYIIGCDNKYKTIIDDNGNTVTDNNYKDYCTDDYSDDKLKKEAVHNIGAMNKAYEDAKLYAETHNVHIYNATRGGMLEVFNRVDFDQMF